MTLFLHTRHIFFVDPLFWGIFRCVPMSSNVKASESSHVFVDSDELFRNAFSFMLHSCFCKRLQDPLLISHFTICTRWHHIIAADSKGLISFVSHYVMDFFQYFSQTATVLPEWTENSWTCLRRIRLRLVNQDRGVCAVHMLTTRGQCPKIKLVCMSPFSHCSVSPYTHLSCLLIFSFFTSCRTAYAIRCWAESAEWPQQGN